MSLRVPTPAHVHAVKTLYRQTIKLQLNWIIDRDMWRASALKTRQRFESNASLVDEGQIMTKMNEGHKWVNDHWHPDPYFIPTQQGGTSFQRNVAPPVEILSVDHGLTHNAIGDGKHH